MPRITKVYTRTGDSGTTGLGNGRRVVKESPRVSAYGSVDELNSHLGVALACGACETVATALGKLQNDLFHLGSDLCMPADDDKTFPVPRIEQRHIDFLEDLMDRLSAELAPLENFILPGGHLAAAHLHVARTVCRRAEREVIALGREESVSTEAIAFLNRLSDALFVLARYQNLAAGEKDIFWSSRA